MRVTGDANKKRHPLHKQDFSLENIALPNLKIKNIKELL